MRFFCMAAFAALLLCGCIARSPSLEWMKGGVIGGPPALSGQLEIDNFVCERTSPAGGGRIDSQNHRSCMIALGWEPASDTPQLSRIASQ